MSERSNLTCYCNQRDLSCQNYDTKQQQCYYWRCL